MVIRDTLRFLYSFIKVEDQRFVIKVIIEEAWITFESSFVKPKDP